MLLFFLYDAYLARSFKKGAQWTKVEEYRRLPMACLGGPLLAVSQFWLVSGLHKQVCLPSLTMCDDI